MKKNVYLSINSMFIQLIKHLSEEQITNLIEGKAKLSYQEIEIKRDKTNHKSIMNMEQCERIATFTTKEEVLNYLHKLNKIDLIEIANYYHVHILKSETKLNIINKIIDIHMGVHLRKQLFEDMKLK